MDMRYVTINYRTGTNRERTYQNVLLATPDLFRFYHPEGGPQYMTLRPDMYDILEDHGVLDIDSDEDWEHIKALRLKNLRDHHLPEVKLSVSAGWLSPSGDFYPCKSWEHDGKAELICRAVLGVFEGTRHLEKVGWLRVYPNGVTSLRYGGPTQKQRDSLWDLYQLSRGEYRHNVGRVIDIYPEIKKLKSPSS